MAAGGSTWELMAKRDRLDSWKREIKGLYGEVEKIELWERKSVDFDIRTRVRANSVSIAAGDIGDTASALTCYVGGGQFKTELTRTLTGDDVFVCVADDLDQEQPFADYVWRVQTWTRSFPDEKVGEEVPT